VPDLLLSFGEFSNFIRECFHKNPKLSEPKASFLDLENRAAYKIENETTKEGLLVLLVIKVRKKNLTNHSLSL
jgi:hypothetical protein